MTFKKGHKINVGKHRIFTDEHKLNLSQSQKGHVPWNKGTKNSNQSIINKERWKSEDYKKRVSLAMRKPKKVGHTVIWKENHSKKMSGDGNSNYGGKCHSLKRIKYKNNTMRSTWEVIVAKWLDSNHYSWEYEPKRFEFKHKKFTYLPDFYVKEMKAYIEVKGWYTDICKQKLESFRREYPTEKLLIIDSNNIDMYKEKING